MFHSRNSVLPQLTFKNIQQTLLLQGLNNVMYIIYMLHICYIRNLLLLCNIVQLVELLSSPLTMLCPLMFSIKESISALMSLITIRQEEQHEPGSCNFLTPDSCFNLPLEHCRESFIKMEGYLKHLKMFLSTFISYVH